jgi:hypothetical protein
MELMAFEAHRVRKGPPLEPGPKDATGVWSGAAIATDPALAGRAVRLELTEASSAKVAGTVTLGDTSATIERGRYDAKTGALACQARVEGGSMLRVEAVLTKSGASGGISMQPALVVAFTATREDGASR